MDWTAIFRDIIQPFLFKGPWPELCPEICPGLFTMSFVTMIISIRTEKRARRIS